LLSTARLCAAGLPFHRRCPLLGFGSGMWSAPRPPSSRLPSLPS